MKMQDTIINMVIDKKVDHDNHHHRIYHLEVLDLDLEVLDPDLIFHRDLQRKNMTAMQTTMDKRSSLKKVDKKPMQMVVLNPT